MWWETVRLPTSHPSSIARYLHINRSSFFALSVQYLGEYTVHQYFTRLFSTTKSKWNRALEKTAILRVLVSGKKWLQLNFSSLCEQHLLSWAQTTFASFKEKQPKSFYEATLVHSKAKQRSATAVPLVKTGVGSVEGLTPPLLLLLMLGLSYLSHVSYTLFAVLSCRTSHSSDRCKKSSVYLFIYVLYTRGFSFRLLLTLVPLCQSVVSITSPWQMKRMRNAWQSLSMQILLFLSGPRTHTYFI